MDNQAEFKNQTDQKSLLPVRKAPVRKPGRFSRFNKSEDGAAAVEFALLGIPFLMMLLFIAELGLHYFASKILQMNTDTIARQVRTGEIRGTATPAEFRQAFCAQPVMFIFDCAKVAINVEEVGEFEFRAKPDRDEDGNLIVDNFDFNPGGRLSINVVQMVYEWPTIVDFSKLTYAAGYGQQDYSVDSWMFGKRIMMGSAAFMTEPF